MFATICTCICGEVVHAAYRPAARATRLSLRHSPSTGMASNAAFRVCDDRVARILRLNALRVRMRLLRHIVVVVLLHILACQHYVC